MKCDKPKLTKHQLEHFKQSFKKSAENINQYRIIASTHELNSTTKTLQLRSSLKLIEMEFIYLSKHIVS